MQKITKQYRNTYAGESVVTEMTRVNQNWQMKEEYIKNQVANNQISNQAVIIGNGTSRLVNDMLANLKNHHGGLLGSRRLQTYGCNALYRDFTPDFLICTGREMVKELANSGYCDDHIVYAGAASIMEHPGKFYLVPQNPTWNAGAIATYLACFDGHKKIYLYGFDGQDTVGHNNNVYVGTNAYPKKDSPSSDLVWNAAMAHLMELYDDVEFIKVSISGNTEIPESWKDKLNFRQIDFRQFALEVDL